MDRVILDLSEIYTECEHELAYLDTFWTGTYGTAWSEVDETPTGKTIAVMVIEQLLSGSISEQDKCAFIDKIVDISMDCYPDNLDTAIMSYVEIVKMNPFVGHVLNSARYVEVIQIYPNQTCEVKVQWK